MMSSAHDAGQGTGIAGVNAFKRPWCEGEMTANALFRIFTIQIGDTPTLTFEAQNMREAQELRHEQWLKDDLAQARSHDIPLWDGKAKLRARTALLTRAPFLPRPKTPDKRLTG
jgi:hypothetical protein